jgi:gamma-glutamylcyclotransferase (GGCT)/AIG2-like uncharacterized protein YtfP
VENYLFVYGTLMSCFSNPHSQLLSENAEKAGICHIRGMLYDLGEYPGLKLTEQPCEVTGELYRLQGSGEDLFKHLDEYEGEEYERILAGVKFNDRNLISWLYVFKESPEGFKEISSGNYFEYIKSIKNGQGQF